MRSGDTPVIQMLMFHYNDCNNLIYRTNNNNVIAALMSELCRTVSLILLLFFTVCGINTIIIIIILIQPMHICILVTLMAWVARINSNCIFFIIIIIIITNDYIETNC